MLSNLIIPAYIYAYVSLYEVCVMSDDWTDELFLAVFMFVTIVFWFTQTIFGAEAYNNLRMKENCNHSLLFPSIFYLLGWIDHDECN